MPSTRSSIPRAAPAEADLVAAVQAQRGLVEDFFKALALATSGNPGIMRDTYGPGEDFAHRLLAEHGRARGLLVERDVAANTYVTLPGRDRTAPRLVIGDGDPGRALPVRSGVAASLRDEVQSRLRREFRQQAVSFRLDRAAALDAGKRYARVEANGIADFGRDGRTPAGVEAIYDRRANAWIQVRYELGSTANRGDVLGG